jgi:geranyl-CoA carboxylase alpha subunit
MADVAMRIGGGPAAESYLNGGAILEAARKAGAEAIHPGYGFLSENAGFAEACAAAGMVFVGPPPAAIHAMGDKARAKALMQRAGVPVVPGYAGADQSEAHLAAEAARLGYPLLIKAAAGGGGRGMRIVEAPAGFAEALAGARREAENAFGDPTVLLERLVRGGRHIELQVFADRHGNVVHLGERDCSTQRRHQKVIEEAPSPFVDETQRAAMGADAVAAARAVGYEGAGTVEFIVGEDRRHYFLEMNTRLQVEHPVTEMITGFDLVEWQLRVAAGEVLPATQEQVALGGHAIEARLYAEDPQAGFRPQTGTILAWTTEAALAVEGMRIDDGIAEGSEVSYFYDPMLAKLIAHGRDREQARRRLVAALERLRIAGVGTNRSLLLAILESDAFAAGAMTTDLLDRWIADGDAIVREAAPEQPAIALAAAALALDEGGDWFRSTGIAECPIDLACGDRTFRNRVRFSRGRLVEVEVDGEAIPFDAVSLAGRRLDWVRDGVPGSAHAVRTGRALWLDIGRRTFAFAEPDPLVRAATASDPTRIVSPVTGLVRFVAATGTAVKAGETVVVIEAMKMETALAARLDGVVRSVRIAVGAQATAGDLLAELDPETGIISGSEEMAESS